MNSENETLTIRYLMGELPPDQRADFERRMFTEPGFLDSVRVLEDQIIRDALTGELPPEQEDRFNKYFLSFPDLRRKYEATKALRHALVAATPTHSAQKVSFGSKEDGSYTKPPFVFRKIMALAACLALLLVCADDVRLRLDRGGSAVVPLTLEPGPIRSGRSHQIRLFLPAGSLVVHVRARVELSDRHGSYRAILKAVDSGQEIASVNGLVAQQAGSFQEVVLDFPTSALGENHYVLSLNGETPSGIEPVEAYSFQIVHARPE